MITVTDYGNAATAASGLLAFGQMWDEACGCGLWGLAPAPW